MMINHKMHESHHNEGVVISKGDESKEDTEDLVVLYCYHLDDIKDHDSHSILIDTGSTVSVFKNKDMLKNMRKESHTMRALTNGGHQVEDSVAVIGCEGRGADCSMPIEFNAGSIAQSMAIA